MFFVLINMKMFKVTANFCLFFFLAKFKSVTFWPGARFGYIRTYMYAAVDSVRFFNFSTFVYI